MSDTLSEARDAYFAELDDGSICPCCDRFGMRYRRPFLASMAVNLIACDAHFKPGEWFHMSDFLRERGMRTSGYETALMRHWDLIDAADGRKDDGNPNTGIYRINLKGHLFAKNLHKIPRVAVIYNNQLERLEGPLIDIVAALGKKFDYSKMMENRGG